MHRITRFSVPFSVVVAGLGMALPSQAAPAAPVLINEVETRGPAGGNDEFVELRNGTPVAVDISDWALRRCNSADTTLTSQIDLTDALGAKLGGTGRFPAGTTIQPNGFLVIANKATGGYAGPADFQYRIGVTDHTGVQLVAPVRDGSGAIVSEVAVDRVGFSGTAQTNSCVETLPAQNTGSNDAYTVSRGNVADAACAAVDTGVNAADFRLATATAGLCNGAAGAGAPVGTVKLSEVDTSGLGGGNDEFIELRNNSPQPADLTGWSLWRCNGADTDLISEITLSGPLGTIPGFGTVYVHHTLWTAPAGAPAAAATYSVGVSDGTGVQLRDASMNVVDSAGFSGDATNNKCVEGAPATAAPANSDLAAARTVAGGVHAVDTNVNAADFSVVARTPGV